MSVFRVTLQRADGTRAEFECDVITADMFAEPFVHVTRLVDLPVDDVRHMAWRQQSGFERGLA